jgi:aryl-phospho-beta-D-glucosidase BglC (GH1 family)
MLSKKDFCRRLSAIALSATMVFGGLTALNAAQSNYNMGDVDCDGMLSANDAACTLNYVLAGVRTGYSSLQLELADVSGDGYIMADDAAMILQHVLDGKPISKVQSTTTEATTATTTQTTTAATTETTTQTTTVTTTETTTQTTTATTTEATTQTTTAATTEATTQTTTATTTETTTQTTTATTDNQSYLEKHGQLRVEGTQLVDKNGDAIVLNGMSTHGIVWFPDFTKSYSIAKTKEAGANVFRVAMYTEEYGGYTSDPSNSKELAYAAVDAAIAQDMYVIMDWHILNDYNPQTHKSEAIDFFKEFSAKYANNPAVLYEICNEPHWVSWSNDIKPYAEDVIPVIRANSPNAVVIVGTNTWSQDVDEASRDLLSFDNVMYSLHFYAGDHYLDSFKSKIETALANGAPVFVTEWGSTKADGNGGVYEDSTRQWLDYLAEKKISWCNWSLSNKDESSAALVSGANAYSWTTDDLSESGKLTFSYLNKNKE